MDAPWDDGKALRVDRPLGVGQGLCDVHRAWLHVARSQIIVFCVVVHLDVKQYENAEDKVIPGMSKMSHTTKVSHYKSVTLQKCSWPPWCRKGNFGPDKLCKKYTWYFFRYCCRASYDRRCRAVPYLAQGRRYYLRLDGRGMGYSEIWSPWTLRRGCRC